MKISFITTVYNEEKTIARFFDSILPQTKLPDEIVIVDGGSSDGTVESIKDKVESIKGNRVKFKIIIKKGNRSVGRNEAIKNAIGDIIVCTDAGNIVDKNWVKEIVKPFADTKIDVVAGYYKGLPKNVFQKCVIPYAFVMPDKVDPGNFLPATRSIAFKRSIWKQVGGFNEKLSHNEDYVFARTLKAIGTKIVFAPKAIVYWIPRSTYREAYIMMWRFAYGDVEAGIIRPKVVFIFMRYIIGIVLLISVLLLKSYLILTTLFFLLVLYILWSISKNYKYVKEWRAFYILPLLQFTADLAVLSGSLHAIIARFFY